MKKINKCEVYEYICNDLYFIYFLVGVLIYIRVCVSALLPSSKIKRGSLRVCVRRCRTPCGGVTPTCGSSARCRSHCCSALSLPWWAEPSFSPPHSSSRRTESELTRPSSQVRRVRRRRCGRSSRRCGRSHVPLFVSPEEPIVVPKSGRSTRVPVSSVLI